MGSFIFQNFEPHIETIPPEDGIQSKSKHTKGEVSFSQVKISGCVCSDQVIFRDPVLCWGHESEFLHSSDSPQRKLIYVPRSPETIWHGYIQTFRKLSTSTGWGSTQCNFQHRPPMSRSIFICCAPFCGRVFSDVLG